jgi:valyl-tRNA synthetase
VSTDPAQPSGFVQPPRHAAPNVPDRPALEGLEERWDAAWEAARTYRFDTAATRDQVYSIDTPPPTVSGSLHVGHVFSYTHTDIVARYQRMCGRAVFYPMGWDDNGLPTERRVQNYYGVRCDPSLPYTPDFTPPHDGDAKSVKAADQVPVSRRNFVELCERLSGEDEKQFEALWRYLGLSIDWTQTYQTIDDDARATSQQAFLRNLARGEAYQAEAPTLWDVTFRTAVAQAELEDRVTPGAYHRVGFHSLATGEPVYIETTRPELLPACVALVAHPDDERYQPLFGTTVRTPLFEVEVPVVSHRLAEPDKGSGIAMICTFGDVTDVIWWRELRLPTRAILGWDGRLTATPPPGIDSPAGQAAYAEIAGKTPFSARARLVELLTASGEMVDAARPITHPVKFYERGDRPLEIVTTRQWYLRNGGLDASLREALLARGRELAWHPEFMRVRYQNWVEGLTSDWLVSRQRFFGVPFPVWYALDDAGAPDYDHLLTPTEADLPIDPSTDVPAGYTAAQRGEPGGFIGDPDVMDTWATSSLTPEIAGRWRSNPDLFARVFPMDLRPQAQDIIRTWLFATTVRAHLEFGSLPFTSAAISGFILDPDRKKMSKSKGNVVTPMALLRQHGSDAVRYWAASARLGTDAEFSEGQMKIGRRLAIKLLNASKFALSFLTDDGDPTDTTEPPGQAGWPTRGRRELTVDPTTVTEPLDRAMLAALAEVTERAGAALAAYDHTRALELTEAFFWMFCDNYIELVKNRVHGRGGDGAALSARTALALALDTVLRLFAPFLPFATEEVWSWWHASSIHREPWPDAAPLREAAGPTTRAALDAAGAVLSALRKVKSDAKVSMRADIADADIAIPESLAEAATSVLPDIMAAGRTAKLTLTPSDVESPQVIKATLAGTE